MAKLETVTGKAISGEWGLDDENGTGIPVLRTTNFTNDGIINFSDVVTRTIKKEDLSSKYLRPGDIIIEKSGGSDKQPVGRVVYYEKEPNRYLFNNFTGVLRIMNPNLWNSKYVFYALYANYLTGGTRKYQNKTTGLHNLKTEQYVKEFELRECSIQEQRQIVFILDKLSEVISLRKEQLSKLDELVKAQFVEMFGDMLLNPLPWPERRLETMADTNYAQSVIDEFSEAKKQPQIAISVDMLDTGIDVPEVLNLVFFKKVMSKAKFWQMIGRGTRLCPGLLDGADKAKFYIFDFCGNFEFFRMSKGKPAASQTALQGTLFKLKAQMALKLQDLAYQTPELTAFRQELVADMVRKVRELNRENFAVCQHLKYVERFSALESYAVLSYEDTLNMEEELVPLILPDEDDARALRFDALLYGIELAVLAGQPYFRAKKDLLNKVSGIAGVANIPEIHAQSELIEKILHTDYLESAEINEFENIRECLRDLIKYIPKRWARYDTDLDNEILSMVWKEAELENDDLKNYKTKAEFYVRQHQDEAVIAKLRGNIPLTAGDVDALERILWSEVGTRQEYEEECGQKPLGEFVREIVGLDMNAAKMAFADYLNDANLDSRQIYFVNQIVEYVVQNGMMKDLSVLQEPPFTDQGSVVEVFTDLSVWLGIRAVIDRINSNALGEKNM